MTEDEAKTKWCPFAHGEGGQNRFNMGAAYASDNTYRVRCIASACMAWRTPRLWVDEYGTSWPNAERKGFCGLAGGQQ